MLRWSSVIDMRSLGENGGSSPEGKGGGSSGGRALSSSGCSPYAFSSAFSSWPDVMRRRAGAEPRLRETDAPRSRVEPTANPTRAWEAATPRPLDRRGMPANMCFNVCGEACRSRCTERPPPVPM